MNSDTVIFRWENIAEDLALDLSQDDLERLLAIFKSLQGSSALEIDLESDSKILETAIQRCKDAAYFIFKKLEYIEWRLDPEFGSEWETEIYQRIWDQMKMIDGYDLNSFIRLLQELKIGKIWTSEVDNWNQDINDFAIIRKGANTALFKTLQWDPLDPEWLDNIQLITTDDISIQGWISWITINSNQKRENTDKEVEISIIRNNNSYAEELTNSLSISSLIDLMGILQSIQNSDLFNISFHWDIIKLRETIKKATEDIHLLFGTTDEIAQREWLNGKWIEIYKKEWDKLIPILVTDTEEDGAWEKWVPTAEEALTYLKNNNISYAYTWRLRDMTLWVEESVIIIDMDYCPMHPDEENEIILREPLDIDFIEELKEKWLFIENLDLLTIEACHE